MMGRRFSTAAATSTQTPAMFCFQCEQTENNKGCTTIGVCGKDSRTAALQDLQLHYNIGLGQLAHAIKTKGGKVSGTVNDFLLDSTFATLTNVNFSAPRFYTYLEEANTHRNNLVAQAQSMGIDTSKIEGPAQFKWSENREVINLEAKSASVLNRKAIMGDDNALVVREMAQYGIKGASAYLNHAERIRKMNANAYTAAASEEVFGKMYQHLNALAPSKPALGDMLGTALGVGEMNLQVLSLLDAAHTSTFGHPVPTKVSTKMSPGKCILVSGHDIPDLYVLLQKTQGTGINVYTHGEMLPAHAYPELKKFPHLKGHYGNAWQRQKVDFAKFPGAILLTSNCLLEPMPSYQERIFSTNSVGSNHVQHLDEFQFDDLIECALQCPGFKQSDCVKKTSTADELLIGFGHNTVMSVAGKVIEAVQKGELKNIFVIGGCDGSEGERNYFTKIGEGVPKDAIALTLGCGKFRINGLDWGTLPNGIPRLLDFGQCNDGYGAVKVALALAEVFKTDVNGLPLHFAVSWFEQKAVAILLTLLHLGVKNIYLGPNLPAFVTPAVVNVLVEKFQLHPCNVANPAADLQQMLARTAPK